MVFKVQSIKENKLYSLKIKNICSSKVIVMEIRQATDLMKILEQNIYLTKDLQINTLM